jgi:addiction module HigA family antidote
MVLKRKPTSPGEILREEYLRPMKLTQRELAQHLGCDLKVINRIINGRAAVSARLAVKLAAALRTSPEFWLNAQEAIDIWKARRELKRLPRPLLASG